MINRVFNWASARFVSHSGAQMALDDAFYEDLPLLVYMVEPGTYSQAVAGERGGR